MTRPNVGVWLTRIKVGLWFWDDWVNEMMFGRDQWPYVWPHEIKSKRAAVDARRKASV